MRLHIHGVHVPNRKNTAELAALRLPIPETVEIPMSMHIGAPAIPVVKPGDSVRVGQLIGKAGGFVSAPVYASVSGTVKKIGQQVGSGGRLMQTVVIAADGKQEPDPTLQPPKLETMQDFLDAVRASGMVGLGGAGFPTVVKLTVKNLEQVQAVIINGAECEPYITSDTRTMLDRSDELMEGARLVQHFLQVRRVIFAIEDNKPRCIQLYRKLTKDEDGMEVCALKSLYPQGGEKVLIYNTIGQIVPEGKLPLDVGAIVLNCTTLANIARYCNTGMPLVEKCITVDGSAVAKPKNVIVPIGMKLADVFEQSGGFCQEPKKVLYGGPMMGIAVPDLEQPVLKNTNAVLAMSEADAVLPEPTACIRCGRCIRHCPLRLMPSHIVAAYEAGDMERLAELKVNLCMECIQKHRHLVDKCARAARTGAVHALVHAVIEENNLCVFSSEFHNNGRIGFFFADDRRRGVNFLNKRYFRGIGKPHTGRARDSDRELTPAQLRLYDAQHFKRLLPHLRKMTLIFVIKHFFTLDKHDFCGRRTYVNAERQNIFFFHNFFLFSLFRSISLYIESKNQIIV